MLKKYLKASALFMALGIVGCGSILGPVQQREVINYQITDPDFLANLPQASNVCANPPNKNVLFVSLMRANAPYNSTKMYYSNVKYELDKYGYSQWAALPTDMLTQAINNKIVLSCNYKNVVTTNALANANYSLITQLIVLRHDINQDNKSSVVRLVIYAQLIDLDRNTVKSSKVFELHADAPAGPAGFTDGINQLVNKFDNQLIDWLKVNN